MKSGLAEFIFSDIKDAEIIFYPVIKKLPFCVRLMKALYYKVNDNFYMNFFPRETTQRLKKIREEDTLIVVCENIYTYWVVSKLCRKVRYKVAFFWNSESDFARQKCTRSINREKDKAKAIVSYIRNLGFYMASFDKRDATLYKMFFYPQFYRFVSVEENIRYKYRFFFCGRDKGRKEIIDLYRKKLTPYGICRFVIMTDGKKIDPIPYNEYVKCIKNTEVLCEIVQQNQTGLTVRAVEALFLNKKLITNNIEIKKYDFYNPNNVLILNPSTSTFEIEQFLRSPIVNIDCSVKSKYDVNTLVRKLDNYAKGQI